MVTQQRCLGSCLHFKFKTQHNFPRSSSAILPTITTTITKIKNTEEKLDSMPFLTGSGMCSYLCIANTSQTD
jgi:hypothetical protein